MTSESKETGAKQPPSATFIEDARGDDREAKDVIVDAASQGQAVTGYERLTPWETIKTFKVCTAVCFAAAFSAATDGYQIGQVFNYSIIFFSHGTGPPVKN